MAKNVFELVEEEKAAYKTTYVPIADGYTWNMYEHIRRSTLYRDSKFTEGENDGSRPFKNIVRRIAGLQHYATGFDVKDIEPFVKNPDYYYKSLLVRKRHPSWAREKNLDTFIDETVESYVDFGLALSKHSSGTPENVPLASIAFCDQTDVLSGPICLRHEYSPAQLKKFDGKWKNIDEVITLARKEKTDPTGKVVKTPGKFIEVYELDGYFPNSWLKDDDAILTEEDESNYSLQFHVLTFYRDEKGNSKGIHLFKGKGDPKKYKAIKRDPVWGRACGFGGIEELFEAQVWTNYDAIRIQNMLDTASKIIGLTNDSALATRNKISDMENGEWVQIADGKMAQQLNLQPVNLTAFENASERWEKHAQGIGGANDALLGESPTAGTPFKLQELVTQAGKGPHEYRKGKIATYFAEIYRDWIIEDLAKELSNEQTFMETLSLEELQYVADRISDNRWFNFAKEKILSGTPVQSGEEEAFKQKMRDSVMRGGTKAFFQLVKDELKGLPMDVEVNVAGKQKNLALMADKLTNIFRTVFANPQGFVQTLQIPGMEGVFNELLESSGLPQINIGAMKQENLSSVLSTPQTPGQTAQAQTLQVAA